MVKLIIIGIVLLLVALAIWEQKDWGDFVKKYDCQIIGETRGKNAFGSGVSSDGNIVSTNYYIPGSKTYKCNDGVTYTR